MNMRISRSLLLRSTCAAVGALVGTLAIANYRAFAQQISATPEATEEVKVAAPAMVERKIVGRTVIGAPIEIISLSRPVSYADLDLTKRSDANELEKRIGDIARTACRQLDNTYPDTSLYQSIPSDQNCIKTATSEAMNMANLVIANTNKTAGKSADNQTAKK